jgi:hypothetical protein
MVCAPGAVWAGCCGNRGSEVCGWAEVRLRKTEKAGDSVSAFKRRCVHVCKHYPSSEKLITSLPGRMAKCICRKGANIGK